ncbi:Peroxidase 43 [Vitis vinifera]|uniref:Peroxidase n=1 Tax=Vitis vinifera TaxID=29760 RepID=A0A438HKS0_VITVI|nr:Peroxidase 43 [Vitis vinifera]
MGVSQGELRVGFYSRTCPQAESIVSSVVREATLSNPRTPALLLRMQFHDCMVEGCDGSILIDNGNAGERMATGNQGLGGFDVIDKAKAMLERVCKGVVSCSDIVALAARDAVFLVYMLCELIPQRNGPFYQVPTGRRDGRVSDISHAANIPEVADSIQLLKSKFRQKGLSDRDLVLLSAAHTIGTTACFFIETRLYNFTRGGGSDPAINPDFLPKLKAKDGLAVIESDAKLYDDRATKRVVDSYIGQRGSSAFGQDFAEAMVKMGNIGVKTGSQGEIRRICTAVNGVPL